MMSQGHTEITHQNQGAHFYHYRKDHFGNQKTNMESTDVQNMELFSNF